jgi:F0F1-type ATP synthase membrane subunit c/vacuolar-type H+-ATPase subunit K
MEENRSVITIVAALVSALAILVILVSFVLLYR